MMQEGQKRGSYQAEHKFKEPGRSVGSRSRYGMRDHTVTITA